MRALSEVEATALAKVGKATDLGDNSFHEVDFFVHVRGSMKQGAGYTQTFPAAANLQALLVVALSKLNAQTAESVAALVDEAEKLEAKALEGELEKVKGYADAAVQRIKEATKRPCKGKLTTALTAVVVPAEAVDKNRAAVAA